MDQQNQFAVFTNQLAYLQELLDKSTLPKDKLQLLQDHLHSQNQDLYLQLAHGKAKLQDSPYEIKNVMSKSQIEDSVLKEFISKAEKERHFLEQKLLAVNSSLQHYQSSPRQKQSKSPGSSRQSVGLQMHEQDLNLKKAIKEMRRKYKRLRQQEKLRLEKSNLESMKQQQKEHLQQAELKRKAVEERIHRLQEKITQRHRFWKQSNQALQAIKAKPLLEQERAKQLQKQQNQQIYERRKKLEDLRRRYKPINHDQLMEHEAKVKQLLEKRMEERKLAREQLQKNIEEQNLGKDYIKSQPFEEPQPDTSNLELLNKARQFALSVKETHLPKIDQTKRKQIQDRISHEAKLNEILLKRKSQIRYHELGNRYLKDLAQLPKPKNKSVLDHREQKLQSTGNSRYKNYLEPKKGTNNSWTQILRTNDPVQKAVRVFYQGQRVQQKLRMREQSTRQSGGDMGGWDEQYMRMVRAKLQALSSFE